MRLTREGIKDREKWLASGIGLPEFDYESVKDKTKESPVWIHFGAKGVSCLDPLRSRQHLQSSSGTCYAEAP